MPVPHTAHSASPVTSTFSKTMKRILRCLLILATSLVIVSAIITIAFTIPITERLDGSKTAKLVSSTPEIHFGLKVTWYDYGLNRKRFQQKLEFDEAGLAILPQYDIPTSLGRLWLKRLLTYFHVWSSCAHCYGPAAESSLYTKNRFDLPANMRLAQNQTESSGTTTFFVNCIPDESKFPPRQFSPLNYTALFQECKSLLASGNRPYIAPSDYGAELLRLNPVRVEAFSGALILWMGGKTGYAIVPDSDTCPGINRVMISPSQHKGIYHLEKL